MELCRFKSYIIVPKGRESCEWESCISQVRRLVKHLAPAGVAGQQKRHLHGQVRPVEARRTFAAVVTGQRVEKERETLSKGIVGRITIHSSSISNEFGQKERFAPGDHVARSWSGTLKFAEEGALFATTLHNLFITLKKDVDRCMEHLGLGRSACEFKP